MHADNCASILLRCTPPYIFRPQFIWRLQESFVPARKCIVVSLHLTLQSITPSIRHLHDDLKGISIRILSAKFWMPHLHLKTQLSGLPIPEIPARMVIIISTTKITRKAIFMGF